MNHRTKFASWPLLAALLPLTITYSGRASAEPTPATHTITAHALGFDGKPLVHAELVVTAIQLPELVLASSPKLWSHVVLTDVNGDFSLPDAPAGSYAVSRYSPVPGEPPMSFPIQTLMGAADHWQLAPKPVDVLRVRLVDEKGAPLNRQLVQYTFSVHKGINVTDHTIAIDVIARAFTNADGIITLNITPPGIYQNLWFLTLDGYAPDNNVYDMTMPAIYDMTVMVRKDNKIRLHPGETRTYGDGPIF